MQTNPDTRRRFAPRHRFELWLLSGALASAGCASVQHGSTRSGYCAPPTPPAQVWREDAAADGSSRVARIGALLGVSRELSEIHAGSRASTLAPRLRVLERLAAARAIVDATVAELDCEGEQTSQLASYLEDLEQRSTLLYTASSIAVGAATGIASAFLAGTDQSDALQETVAVAGGAATAALGLVPLYRHTRAEFRHTRNMLADVWLGPAQPTTFPHLVWAYLTRPEFSNAQSESIRVRIVERWRRYEALQLEARGSAHEQNREPAAVGLLFGAGGLYDTDSLRRRADMLDQVKAEVDLMNQELAELAMTLSQEASDPPP